RLGSIGKAFEIGSIVTNNKAADIYKIIEVLKRNEIYALQ
ncbi:930_t:CDS:2, partial [Acaulospora morrowiae]